MRKTIVFIAVVNLFILTAFASSVSGEIDQRLLGIPSMNLAQENISEPAPLKLFLYGGEGGELNPQVPIANSSNEVECAGYPLARAAGYYIGTWTSAPLTMPLIIDTQFYCSLWVYSSQGASNVHFNVEIQVSGNQRFSFQTESMGVSQTPVEIKGDGTRDSSLELLAGDTLGVRLAYFSDPARLVGPGSSSTLIVGSDEYSTHITVTTSPMSLSTNAPQVIEDQVKFSATFIDAFSATRLHAHLMISGIVEAVSISEPIFALGENGSLVSWDWNFKSDKARDGDYKVSVSLCYGDENDFNAWGMYFIEFHEHEEEEGLIESLGILFPIIIIAITAVIVVITVKVILNRRATKSSL